MTTRTTPWPHGAPCWAALSTADESRARAFYATVLGWAFRDVGPRDHDWTIAEVDGRAVAGLGAMAQTESASSWLLAFAAQDLGLAAAGVVNGGGAILQPPHAVLAGAARSAIARDPGGRRFMLLEAGEFIGFGTVNRAGAVVWEEGIGPVGAVDREFYTELFGWEVRPAPEAGEHAVQFGAPGEPERPWGSLDGGADLAPHWLLWFGVDSLDTALDRLVGAGGGVLSGPHDLPWGRLARVQDPDGAQFGLLAADPADLPDRSG